LLALSIGLPNIAQEAMETIEVDFPQPEILSDFSRASDWTIEIAQADFEPLKVQAMTIPAGPELMSGERIPSSLVLEIQTATPQITTVHLLMSESLTIEESAVSFNLWVQGSNRSHWISVLLVDENGAQHKLPLEKSNYRGWKQISRYLPYEFNNKSLRILGLAVDYDPLALGPFSDELAFAMLEVLQ
jgi:hypothetical protein